IRHLLETSYSLKISLLDTQQNTFKLLQVVLVADNQIPRSLETSEEGRTRAFVDLLTSRLPYSVVNAPPIKWNEIQQLATKCTLVEYSVNNEPQEGKQNTKPVLYIWVLGKTTEIHFEKVELDKIPYLVDTLKN